MNINIEIGDVVLDGVNFTESQALELRQALQGELTGLVGSMSRVGDRPGSQAVGLSHLQSSVDSSPHALAAGLAHSIDQSLRPQTG